MKYSTLENEYLRRNYKGLHHVHAGVYVYSVRVFECVFLYTYAYMTECNTQIKKLHKRWQTRHAWVVQPL